MSKERDQLELAAKACGRLGPHGNLTLTRPNEELHRDDSGYWFWPIGDRWNPLTDDGDALRLAVTLGLGISIPLAYKRTDVVTFDGPIISVIEVHGDPYAATRRAIVRAAAEIGRTM